ncbi:MAG: dTDP-4-dehydrorhamnose reductase [Candidatus Delongbacteria bacterium]|nr:dTDP-4-dehydrorhamnose reductase [Candidatus Delongbacteria bacterium]
MKYFISGANGQLGREIRDSSVKYPDSVFEFHGSDFDIRDNIKLTDHFKDREFDYFINCAAYTDVENAEKDPENTFKINHSALKNIIGICNKKDITLIHFSTDFVFNGEKTSPYNENDDPDPLSVYGESKYRGEQLIIEECKRYIILRVSWLYSVYGNNFVKKIIDLSRKNDTLNVVSDETGSPTNAKDLAQDILLITEQKLNKDSMNVAELYHYANAGCVSRYEFAKKIVEYAGIDCKINPVSSGYFNFMAKRPKNSILDQSKIIEEFDLIIRNWDDSLQECIKNIVSDEK